MEKIVQATSISNSFLYIKMLFCSFLRLHNKLLKMWWLQFGLNFEVKYLFSYVSSINSVHFSSVQVLSRVWLFATTWIATHKASLCITNSTSLFKLMSIESVILFNHLILSHPLLLLLSIFSSIRVFPMSQSFELGGQCTGISASASVLPMNTQDRFPLGLMGLTSLQSKGLLESSPTPQFKSTHSSALSFLYSLTLTSIHDYRKNHSFD